ncbi:MAG TPA: carboxypeptidase regulatory-like domain-containing protein [Polyangia bacterium]
MPRAAWAADAADVEELRREVRQLKSQIQALRTAITEAAEFDRQRAALLTRALKGIGSGGSSEAEPARSDSAPSRASEPVAESHAPAAPSRREMAAARRAPVAAPPAPSVSENTVGTIRGKITVPSGEPVAYVYVENVLAAPVKGQHKVIEQTGKKFVPAWAVVQRGTSIAFPNMDNIYHNVFSLSSGNQFDLGLYNSGGDPKTHTFNEPGSVDVYCNIHPQMAASVLVVPNKLFAKVKPDGSFEIPGVPTGRRKVVAWAPGSRMTTDWVEVGAGSSVDINLRLDSKAPGHKNKVGQAYGSYE